MAEHKTESQGPKDAQLMIVNVEMEPQFPRPQFQFHSHSHSVRLWKWKMKFKIILQLNYLSYCCPGVWPIPIRGPIYCASDSRRNLEERKEQAAYKFAFMPKTIIELTPRTRMWMAEVGSTWRYPRIFHCIHFVYTYMYVLYKINDLFIYNITNFTS